MAATLANAIKALIEGSGLGLSAYRDVAPSTERRPFVTVSDGIARTPRGRADGGTDAWREICQVDLRETWQFDGEGEEEPQLAMALDSLLHGAALPNAPVRVHGMSVVSSRRLLE